MPAWRLRPATHADAEFLYALRRTAFAEHVARTYGDWDEDWQRARFDGGFDPGRSSIVILDGDDASGRPSGSVGELAVDWEQDPVFLSGIALVPEARGQGLGTALIGAVLDQARGLGRSVWLQVFVVNVDAARLYERLGFQAIDASGTHVQMLWCPQPAQVR